MITLVFMNVWPITLSVPFAEETVHAFSAGPTPGGVTMSELQVVMLAAGLGPIGTIAAISATVGI